LCKIVRKGTHDLFFLWCHVSGRGL
jgi:hypothetical protein